MKKIVLIVACFINSLIYAKDLLIIPYAYYAGQNYCLLLKAPDRSIITIQDTPKKAEDLVERAAKAASLQTKALWGKYQKDNAQFYKRRPSKADYYQSVSFFTEKLAEAVESELVMKTERYAIWFVEVPYIQSDWLQKAPQLSEAVDSWFALHQLVWVKMHALFEQKGDAWLVKRRIVGLNGQLEGTVKDRLNQFGSYKSESLGTIIRPRSALGRVLERSAVRPRKIITPSYSSSVHSSVYGSRLRRQRRTNR